MDDHRTIELLEAALAKEQRRFRALSVDLENAEADLKAKRRHIATLEGQITKLQRARVTEAEIQEVWAEYVAVVVDPRQRGRVTLGDGRKKMIRDRIREIREDPNVDENPVERLKLAVRGLAARPYVRAGGGRTGDPKGAKRWADLKYALGSDERVETATGWLEPDRPTVAPIRRRGPDPFERPVDKVLEALRRLDLTYRPGWGGQQSWSAQCPAHDDRAPSLSIREGDDGRALLHCFAGCEVPAICDALGLSLSELFVRDAA